MYILSDIIKFPDASYADSDGLLALGGDLSVDRLLEAYRNGIFPWYNEGEPILWHSPNPRMVLFPEELKISKSMRQLIRKDKFEVTFNTNFDNVILNCATIKRSGEEGTWITQEMRDAFLQLHRLGHVISVEVWENSILVGGLYGVWLDTQKIFCGESMFAKVSNASKYGFIKLIEYLNNYGLKLVDCQVYTDHLASLGAREISRDQFIKLLKP
ncbi:leucyl/phenylalanyl-tRNA--protein transferase [Aquimarina algicola]|uniref:Leucyl/phenylalanyl-tRNA--protein transferase n=1 Tax=Aquimarina algicola TaxID=2589995 RepID=A0A504JIV9_9FLAO|nr:leucyl/phenylalanyl-tRNA--protein transferase [Aquimarina algicola]TPN87553.1 leucyl/phenylalanyl-tRNA--protein transferase [Aquimarina algicola]